MRHRRLCYLSAALPPSIHDQCVRHCRLCHLSAALPPIIHGSIYNLRPMLLVCGVAAPRSFRLNLQSFAWSRQFRAIGKPSLRRVGHISDDQIHDGPAFVEIPETPTAKKVALVSLQVTKLKTYHHPCQTGRLFAFKSQLRMGYLTTVLHRRLLTPIAR